jgi:hypothetical protein
MATTETTTRPDTTGTSARAAPINGGVETFDGVDIPWTGGSRQATTARTEPASIKAYRPNDFKSKRKAEEDCQDGLGTENRLKTPEEILKDADAVLMTDWIGQLQMFMENTGQDGVFHFMVNTTEVNLLKNYGSITPEQVTNGVRAIKTTACPYDLQNLRTSAVAIRASLTNSMLQRIKARVELNASGPEVLAAVIAIHQVLDSSGCRVLVDELRVMRLNNFPAENVDEFNLKILEKCRRIDSCIGKPADLASMVAECYLHTQSLHFNMKAEALYDTATEGGSVSWSDIVTQLGTVYRKLLNRGQWPAASNRKEDTIKALQGRINKLEASLKQRGSGNGNGNGNGSGRGNGQEETRTCHHCKKVGHIKPNCPELKLAGGGQANKGIEQKTPAQPSVPSTLPGKKRYEAPGPNDSHTKQLGNDTWKWCGTCKRWNKGASAHLTKEHKSKIRHGCTIVAISCVGSYACFSTGGTFDRIPKNPEK